MLDKRGKNSYEYIIAKCQENCNAIVTHSDDKAAQESFPMQNFSNLWRERKADVEKAVSDRKLIILAWNRQEASSSYVSRLREF